MSQILPCILYLELLQSAVQAAEEASRGADGRQRDVERGHRPGTGFNGKFHACVLARKWLEIHIHS